jgi:hypothetical protein
MNNTVNNTMLAVRKPTPLVRVWYSTGSPGTPLVCRWVRVDAATVGVNTVEQKSDQPGGLLLCA